MLDKAKEPPHQESLGTIAEEPFLRTLDELLADSSKTRRSAETVLREEGTKRGFLYTLVCYVCTSVAPHGSLCFHGYKTLTDAESNGLDASSAGSYPPRKGPETLEDRNDDAVTEPTSLLGGGSSEVVPDEPAFSHCFDAAKNEPPSTESLARRTLAAVLAKHLVRERWHLISNAERSAIKSLLLLYLVRLPEALQPTVRVFIADIAAAEIAKAEWPELFPGVCHLMHLCHERQSTKGICALLELLVSMAEQPKGVLAAQILDQAHGVQDGLLHLALGMRQFNFARKHEEATIPGICRRKCLSIYQLCVQAVLRLRSSGKLEQLILPQLPKWTSVFLSLLDDLLASPVDLNAIQNALIVLRCMSTLFSGRSREVERLAFGCLQEIVQKSIEVLRLYYPVYENMVINDRDGDALVEETAEGGPTSFVVQLCDLLVLCLHRKRYSATLFENQVGTFLPVLIKYFQISEAQTRLWLEDSNEYLISETEEGGCCLELSSRVAGAKLITACLKEFQQETMTRLLESAFDLLKPQSDGVTPDPVPKGLMPDGWRFLELAFWLIGLIFTRVDTTSLKEELYGRPEIETTIHLLGQALGDSRSPPLLRARALLTAAALRVFLTEQYPNDLLSVLMVAASAVEASAPPPVRVAGCRALDVFFPFCESASMWVARENNVTTYTTYAAMQDAKMGLMFERNVLENVVDLITTGTEDSLRLGLDVLTRIAHECPQAIEVVKETFLPLVLEVWKRSSQNPLVNLCFQEFVAAACRTSRSLGEYLELLLLPIILKTLREGACDERRSHVEPHALGVALEFYSVLVRASPLPLSSMLWEGFALVLSVLQNIEEASIIHSACEALALLMKAANHEMRRENKVEDIMAVVERLLAPELEDQAALTAGPLLQVFMHHFGEDLSEIFVQQVFSSMLRRMMTAEVPALQRALMVVLSRFVCFSPQRTLSVLENTTMVCSQSRQLSGLVVLITYWLELFPTAETIHRSRYARNVTYAALISLLNECRGDLPVLANGVDVPAAVLRILICGLRSVCTQQKRNRRHVTRKTTGHKAWVPSFSRAKSITETSVTAQPTALLGSGCGRPVHSEDEVVQGDLLETAKRRFESDNGSGSSDQDNRGAVDGGNPVPDDEDEEEEASEKSLVDMEDEADVEAIKEGAEEKSDELAFSEPLSKLIDLDATLDSEENTVLSRANGSRCVSSESGSSLTEERWRQSAYRDVFAEEEQKDSFSRLDTQVRQGGEATRAEKLLYKALKGFWAVESPYASTFRDLETPTLATWRECLYLCHSKCVKSDSSEENFSRVLTESAIKYSERGVGERGHLVGGHSLSHSSRASSPVGSPSRASAVLLEP